ncbi:MAG: hypothetical protein K9H25_01650 [Rhodospirillum sp.]|nr:hypothetical protein [Rhodospirillum sp.]MCF8488151.1 hypothetical protein [Rhodospirillum sp.]MCF8502862.1 hypothetical protein [Rhodospirillum sp.]
MTMRETVTETPRPAIGSSGTEDDRREEELLDEALEESFPSSDPISPARPHAPGKGRSALRTLI